jgi:hypothetical protein
MLMRICILAITPLRFFFIPKRWDILENHEIEMVNLLMDAYSSAAPDPVFAFWGSV